MNEKQQDEILKQITEYGTYSEFRQGYVAGLIKQHGHEVESSFFEEVIKTQGLNNLVWAALAKVIEALLELTEL